MKLRKNEVLVLRSCDPSMKSYGGFEWPKSGPLSAPDWKPTKQCGNGLHGFLWGEGYSYLADHSLASNWLVVKTNSSAIIDLRGKVKFPKGEVVFCGDRSKAAEFIIANGGAGRVVIGANVSAGARGTATAGDYGTAKAGNFGTAKAGNFGTATAGDYGNATAGDGGTAKAGYRGTAKAGYYGTSKAGDYGTAKAGNFGTATAGDYGNATAGNFGTAKAGDGGILNIHWHDGNRYRSSTAYIGKKGILPNTPYKLNEQGQFELV